MTGLLAAAGPLAVKSLRKLIGDEKAGAKAEAQVSASRAVLQHLYGSHDLVTLEAKVDEMTARPGW